MNLPFSHPANGDGPGSAFDARPIVANHRNNRAVWWFAGGTVIAAILLFSALEARRRGVEQADRTSPATIYGMPEAIPDLVMPAQPADLAESFPNTATWPQPSDRYGPRPSPAFVPQSRGPIGNGGYTPQVVPEGVYPAPPPPPLMVSGQQIPPNADGAGFDGPPRAAARPAGGIDRRIMAGRLENPATTVVQGTLINAVLETALDSTRPGQARALVTRDVYGFDGTRLLIPRGTRLYGVYQADLAQGQKRAQIRWTRLLRPDGVSVALDSPAADPLGRAGVEGKVNNHFIQRFGNALLGTTASIGSALVTRSITSSSPVVVAVPGATQTATQAVTPSSGQIAPTLTVNQGTRVTVFVQHDLDFTNVDQEP